MKPVFTTISAVLLICGLGIGAAEALPRIDGAAVGATAAAPSFVEKARLVCNYRRCFRVGGYRYYRPYYRPYYYRPGIGVGIGPFGVGIY